MKEISEKLSLAVRKAGLPGIVCAAAGLRDLLDETSCGHVDFANDVRMSLDTTFWVASITKIATTVAVLQLVERGFLRLDDHVAKYLPFFESLDVLTDVGVVPARSRVTVQHLLTHTAGFGYEAWSRPLAEHVLLKNLPAAKTGRRAALERPLLFQPGTAWNYGIGMDWAGCLVEKISGRSLADYLQANVFGPLGMQSTGFMLVTGAQTAALYTRQPDGTLVQTPNEPNPLREFDSGGAGLYSTPRDVLRLLQSILRADAGSTQEVLSPTMAARARLNQIHSLEVRDLPSCALERTMDLALFPGRQRKWSHFGLLHLEALPGGRSAGSVSWAGIANTFFWIDFEASLAAIVFAQSLPFLDPALLPIVDIYERFLYAALPRARLATTS